MTPIVARVAAMLATILALALIAIALIAPATASARPASRSLAVQQVGDCTPEWELAFEDQFEGTQVDATSWDIYNSPGHAGNGLRRPSAMSVADGMLTITGTDVGGQVVSGGMATQGSWTYGRFEARVRTKSDPTDTMSGVVIAWPNEQDFVSNYRELNLYETGHIGPRRPLHMWVHYEIPNNPARPHFTADVDAEHWHDVQMDWTDSRVAFWVDGTFVGETTRAETIPHRPMSMTLQLDAFSSFIGGDDVTMDVDWARVWSWNDGGAENCLADVPGADSPVHVMHTTTCLGGNGRFDTNIVNTGEAAATYRIEFEGLSPREFRVEPGDFWRMPITGRRDGSHEVVVRRNGVEISREHAVVACDGEAALVTPDEVQVVNGCRAGRGYVLFQFANPTSDQRSWVIKFEGVPNRSTSTSPAGGTVRAVTGRASGTYDVTIENSGVPIADFAVTIDCADDAALHELSVRTTYEDGFPAEGVKVDLYESDGSNRIPGSFVEAVMTDPQGDYAWELPQGCWAIVVSALAGTTFALGDPLAIYDERHACLDDAGASFTSVLYRPQFANAIDVTASWEDGSPASGVSVDLYEEADDGSRGTYLGKRATNVDGVALFDVVAGCYIAVVEAAPGSSFSLDEQQRYSELQGCVSNAHLGHNITLYRAENVFVLSGTTPLDGEGLPPTTKVDLFFSAGNGVRGEFIGAGFTDDGGFSFNVLDDCYAIVAIAPSGWSFEQFASETYAEVHRCTNGSDIMLEPMTLYRAPVVA